MSIFHGEVTQGTGGLQHHNFFILDGKQHPKIIWFLGCSHVPLRKTNAEFLPSAKSSKMNHYSKPYNQSVCRIKKRFVKYPSVQ